MEFPLAFAQVGWTLETLVRNATLKNFLEKVLLEKTTKNIIFFFFYQWLFLFITG